MSDSAPRLNGRGRRRWPPPSAAPLNRYVFRVRFFVLTTLTDVLHDLMQASLGLYIFFKTMRE